MRRIVFILGGFLSAWVSLRAVSPQKPVTSEFFQTSGGGIGIDQEKHVAFYGVNLKVRKPIADGAVADFLFDDPADPKKPLLVTVVIKGNPPELAVQSPNLTKVKNHQVYQFKVVLYSDESRRTKLGEHVQGLGFDLPNNVFKMYLGPAAGP